MLIYKLRLVHFVFPVWHYEFGQKYSCILLNVFRPLMLLRFLKCFGGCIFGSGLNISCFYMCGHVPCLMEEINWIVKGIESTSANFFFIPFWGMSSTGTDFVGLNFSCFYFFTSDSLNWSKDSSSKNNDNFCSVHWIKVLSNGTNVIGNFFSPDLDEINCLFHHIKLVDIYIDHMHIFFSALRTIEKDF